ncbi:MAG: tRNA (adenosine(37)-N6)-threonylcarbamoyltransferase complex ATPase subunit type 1 TsaE [Chloroflexi bacterium]|nr:tRNA (adenosine(37)-N6)-threonylcarbamoyltransferase complex ATPase subunit type 1 TsaE [Chloroflexota bacterium]
MTEPLVMTTSSPQETQALGRKLGALARAGDVYLLSGALGTGKTCLTQGIAWGLGVQEYAHSPTFVLVHVYRGRLPVYHMDLFRIDDIREVVDLGIDDYLEGDGVCVVEWAEKAVEAFPVEHLLVRLEHVGEQERRLTLEPRGHRYRELVEALRLALGSAEVQR